MFYPQKKQQGMTMISLVMLLVVIGGIVLLFFKIVPIYMNHGKVKSAIESLASIPELESKSKHQIQEFLQKRLRVNSVYELPKKAIKIIKRGNYVKISAKYDIKEPIVGNLNVLIEFNDFI
ncbi:MAG: DUF4845 domain-containing protein, partial [Methylococcales bacterium]|nr:DUF4845 domain-containing protein [Methylococcales bacterium]